LSPIFWENHGLQKMPFMGYNEKKRFGASGETLLPEL
jgi:hypothetical protein